MEADFDREEADASAANRCCLSCGRAIVQAIQALEAKGVDLKDFTVVGPNVVIANFEGNYRPDGTRIRQQPWWDKGYTIDIFYLAYFFFAVFVIVKRLPPTTWEPRHGHGGH